MSEKTIKQVICDKCQKKIEPSKVFFVFTGGLETIFNSKKDKAVFPLVKETPKPPMGAYFAYKYEPVEYLEQHICEDCILKIIQDTKLNQIVADEWKKNLKD